MEPVVMAGTLLLLVAVVMLPFVLVIGLWLGALRTILDAKPWLHDELPAEDAWTAADRRPNQHVRAGTASAAKRQAEDDVPVRGFGIMAVRWASPA